MLAMDDAGDIVGEFPGWGVWYEPWFGENAGWQQLTAANASSLAVGKWETYVGPPDLNPNPVAGPTFVAAAFPGHGVWRLSIESPLPGPRPWQQLTASDAATVGINVHGDVVGSFPGWGVWSYSDAGAGGYYPGWIHLTAADAPLVGIDAAGNVFGQFAGWGVWYDRFGYWQCITPSNATAFGAGG
jgi:hypothetical protein